MMGFPIDDLPKYDQYIHSIKVLAKALRIKLLWETYPSDGAWLPTRRAIKIDPDLSNSETLATLLHEMGHAVDDSVMQEKDSIVVGESYAVIYTDYYSTKDVDMVVRAEIRAWNYGAAIAKNLGINRGKWYDRYAKKAIKDYKKLSKGAK